MALQGSMMDSQTEYTFVNQNLRRWDIEGKNFQTVCDLHPEKWYLQRTELLVTDTIFHRKTIHFRRSGWDHRVFCSQFAYAASTTYQGKNLLNHIRQLPTRALQQKKLSQSICNIHLGNFNRTALCITENSLERPLQNWALHLANNSKTKPIIQKGVRETP